MGVAVPYGLLDPQEGLMQRNVARIEKELRPPSGGLRPYAADTYYGEWIPTTAWLGWYYAEIGERGAAAQLLAWVASQADDQVTFQNRFPTP
jgi:GH15 family glucan-1,4-alpha-glucosidase